MELSIIISVSPQKYQSIQFYSRQCGTGAVYIYPSHYEDGKTKGMGTTDDMGKGVSTPSHYEDGKTQ